MITLNNREEFGDALRDIGLRVDSSIHIVEGLANGIECDVRCKGLDTTNIVSALFKKEDRAMTVHMSYDVRTSSREELLVISNFSSRAQMLCDIANRFYKYLF